MKQPLKRSEKWKWVVGPFCWVGIAYAIYQRNPLYFYPFVIPYMLVGWFSHKIDGES